MQTNLPQTQPHLRRSLARRSTRGLLALLVASVACAGTLSACVRDRPASAPPASVVTTAPAPDAPSAPSRGLDDGRDAPDDEVASPAVDDGDGDDDGGREFGEGLVRGLGPRGHDAR